VKKCRVNARGKIEKYRDVGFYFSIVGFSVFLNVGVCFDFFKYRDIGVGVGYLIDTPLMRSEGELLVQCNSTGINNRGQDKMMETSSDGG